MQKAPEPIVITCGDLNGIGIECLVKCLPSIPKTIPLQLIAPIKSLQAHLRLTNLPAEVNGSTLIVNAGNTFHSLEIQDLSTECEINLGTIDKNAGSVSISALQKSIELLQLGKASAVVTLPVSKEANMLAGWRFPGQTEMFGESFTGTPLMMLCSETVRVALATVHIPISRVSATLTQELIVNTTTILNNALISDFGISNPSIALLGLNPHAGENGLIGVEEETTIGPACKHLQEMGIHVNGSYPADGFFAFGEYKQFDAIVAMYHDQGLIPLKLLAKGAGVNATLGLDIIRTSPDHGTAFSIAGKNLADPASTIEAIQLAIQMVQQRMRV